MLADLDAQYELDDEVYEAFELKYGKLGAANFGKLAQYCAAKAEKRRPDVVASPMRTAPISPDGKRRLPVSAVTPDNQPKKAKGNAIWSPSAYSPEKAPSPFSRTPGHNGANVKTLLNPGVPKAHGSPPVTLLPAADGMYRSVTTMPASLADGLNARSERLERLIEATPDLADIPKASVGEVSMERCVVTGRICCEVEFTDARTRLTEQSLLLEGSRAAANGARIELRTSACPQVTCFPGQVVAAVGTTDAQGRVFHAEQLLAGAPVEPCTREATAPVSLVVAAGPFTPSDSLAFEGLDQVMAYVEQEKPGVVVLLGPLLEHANKHVASGDLQRGNEPGLAGQPCSFDDVYELVIFPKLRKLAGLGAQIVVVPALGEVGLPCPALPQPKYAFRTAEWARLAAMPNVHAASNPCVLEVAGLRVAVTAQDPVLPVLSDMINAKREGDAPPIVDAALDMLFAQRSFFPVHPVPRPSHPGVGVLRICPTRLADLEFDELPDVCICHSKLQYFAKCRNGRVFVNPGPVAKNPTGWGSLAALHIAKGRPADAVRVDVVKL